MIERGGMQKYWMILQSISKYHYQGRVQSNGWWKGCSIKKVLQKIFLYITISREGYNRWWKGARCNVINYNHFPSSLNPPWEPNIMTLIYTQIYPNTLKHTQIRKNIPKDTQIYSNTLKYNDTQSSLRTKNNDIDTKEAEERRANEANRYMVKILPFNDKCTERLFTSSLLAPSGALIAIPIYYWPSNTTTHFFQIHTGPQYWTFTFWATTAISKAITGLICWLPVYHMGTTGHHCKIMQDSAG